MSKRKLDLFMLGKRLQSGSSRGAEGGWDALKSHAQRAAYLASMPRPAHVCRLLAFLLAHDIQHRPDGAFGDGAPIPVVDSLQARERTSRVGLVHYSSAVF